MEINPIKTEKDYEETLLEIESLFGAKLGSEESDRLDILVTLTRAYEAVHYPIGLPDPISAIEYEMDKRGLTRKDLAGPIGPSGRISEILNRQRSLTMAMIRSLHAEFGIRLDILIQDYPLTGRSDKAMASSDVEVDPKDSQQYNPEHIRGQDDNGDFSGKLFAYGEEAFAYGDQEFVLENGVLESIEIEALIGPAPSRNYSDNRLASPISGPEVEETLDFDPHEESKLHY